jgi:hypothetical protein
LECIRDLDLRICLFGPSGNGFVDVHDFFGCVGLRWVLTVLVIKKVIPINKDFTRAAGQATFPLIFLNQRGRALILDV